jgi:hypothetical protein
LWKQQAELRIAQAPEQVRLPQRCHAGSGGTLKDLVRYLRPIVIALKVVRAEEHEGTWSRVTHASKELPFDRRQKSRPAQGACKRIESFR